MGERKYFLNTASRCRIRASSSAASVSASLGIAELPCYVGATDSRLKRLSGPAFARKRALIEGRAAGA